MRDVSLRQLRFLAETVRTGSLAGAAAATHVTAPAVAQQLRLLEKQVGTPLLERGPHGQVPTEAGRILALTAARVDAELQTCADTIASLRRADSGHVTIGAVSTTKYFVPRVIAAFRKAHPGVQVTMRIGNREEILAKLEDYQVDLAVMGRVPDRLEVDQQVLGAHPYGIVAGPDHPLIGQTRLPFERVAAEPFLVREPGSGTRIHAEDLFASIGGSPSFNMEMPSNESIKQAVMAGLGVALLSLHTVGAELADGRLGLLDVTGLPIMREWLIVRLQRRSVSPAMLTMWDFFRDECPGYLPSVG